jgi:hypothetical protein
MTLHERYPWLELIIDTFLEASKKKGKREMQYVVTDKNYRIR